MARIKLELRDSRELSAETELPPTDGAEPELVGTAGWLHQAAFVLALTVVGARPTLGEEWGYSQRWAALAGLPGSVGTGSWTPATPALSLMLTLLTVLAGWLYLASCVAAGRLVWRSVGGLLGPALIALGTLWSTLTVLRNADALGGAYAFTAVTTGAAWLGQLLLFVLLVQLCRRNWQLRWLSVTLVASLALCAGKAVWQVSYELPATRQLFETRRVMDRLPRELAEELLTPTGKASPPSSTESNSPEPSDRESADAAASTATSEERARRWFRDRLDRGSATGYAAHSNIFGAMLMVGLLLAVGLGTDTISRTAGNGPARRLAYGATVGVAGLIAIGLMLTDSRGAMAATAVAVAAYVAVRGWGSRLLPRKWTLLIVGAALLAVAVGSVIAIGSQRDALPERSLNYRWQYWQATMRLLADRPDPADPENATVTGHWLRGVGPGNFGEWYPAVMAADAVEEVRSPHCTPLQAWAELGLLGGVGLLVWVGWLAVWTVRRAGVGPEPVLPESFVDPDKKSAALWRLIGYTALPVLGVLAVWAWVGTGGDLILLLAGGGLPAFLYWALTLILHSDQAEPTPLSDAPMSATVTAAGCALLGAALHGLIDYPLFWPASATVLLAASAVLVAGQNLAAPTDRQESRQPLPPIAGVPMLALLAVLVGLLYVRLLEPTRQMDGKLAQARRLFDNPTSAEDLAKARQLLVEAADMGAKPDLTAGEATARASSGSSLSLDLNRRDPAPWEGLVDLHTRRFHRIQQEARSLASGRRVAAPGAANLDLSPMVRDFRRRAVAESRELRYSLEGLSRLRPMDPGPLVANADLHLRIRNQLRAELSGTDDPVLTPLVEVPLFGEVLNHMGSRILAIEEANRFHHLAAAAIEGALRRQPRDAELMLLTARISEGVRPPVVVAARYRRALELSDAREAVAPGNGLLDADRRQAQRALETYQQLAERK